MRPSGLVPRAHVPAPPLRPHRSSSRRLITQQSRRSVQNDVCSLQPPAAATVYKDYCQTALKPFSLQKADGMQKTWQSSKEQALKPQRCVCVCVSQPGPGDRESGDSHRMVLCLPCFYRLCRNSSQLILKGLVGGHRSHCSHVALSIPAQLPAATA